MIQRLLAFIIYILCAPILIILFVLIRLDSAGPFLFKQKRLGKNKKEFLIYKIRTMQKDAEKIKERYRTMNETTGPVFKIRNDPRYTPIGKFLSHTGLDELPQLINIIKGDMAFVGPRPLPVQEAQAVPEKYQRRFEVLPGITSLWVIKGTHNLTFDEWMKLDVWYVNHQTWLLDLQIAGITILLLLKLLIQNIKTVMMKRL